MRHYVKQLAIFFAHYNYELYSVLIDAENKALKPTTTVYHLAYRIGIDKILSSDTKNTLEIKISIINGL